MNKKIPLSVCVLLFLAMVAFAVFTFHSARSRERDNICRVLNEQCSAIHLSVNKQKRFSRPAYIKNLKAISSAGCPQDFRLAWLDFVHAQENYHQPDILIDLAAAGISASYGSTIGASFAANDIKRASSGAAAIEQARQNLETASLKHGVELKN